MFGDSVEFVMPGLVPGIHVLADTPQERRGWHLNSGLPEFTEFGAQIA
jgi:hypothetical protein